MSKKRIYVSLGSEHNLYWIENSIICKEIEEADAILLLGGGDVHPSYYGGMNGVSYTWDKSLTPGNRCKIESHQIDIALEKKIPLIGICRGFQWICVKAGGSLIQDVYGHSHQYGVRSLLNNELYSVNSLHHQLIYPFNMDKENYQIIGVIDKPTSSRYILNGVPIKTIPYEIEIGYFNNINGFGVQFHPEIMNYRHDKKILDYLNELMHETIWSKK